MPDEILPWILAASLAAPGLGLADEPATREGTTSPRPDPLHHVLGPVDVRLSFESAAQALVGSHAFWGLAQQFAPAAGYPTGHAWVEGYAKPGVRLRYTPWEPLEVRAGVAAVASGTVGTDYFEEGDTGRVLPEEAYLGVRWTPPGSEVAVDLSAGRQPFILGNQLVLAVGAGNGFERGAVTLFPYRAWELAAVGRLSWRQVSAEGFYLEPHELKSNDLRNRLAGANVKWEPAPGQYLGAAFIGVVESAFPYPQAPVVVIPDGRDGLLAYDAYWKWAPTDGAWNGFSFLGEVVIQRHDRIDMEAWGGGIEIGYRLLRLPLAPRISYSPRYFSGDDPSTPGTLERFDPLFYMASPDTWSSGGNGSLSFLNANIVAHRIRLELALSPRDFLNLNYWYVQAAEANSQIQFGQAARITLTGGAPALVSGVPDRELSHEVYVEHTHAFGTHVFLTAGIGGSIPGRGIRAVVPQGAEDWWGGLVNLSIRF